MKPKVFILNEFYYPGFKAGGPIKSIRSLIHALEDKFDFRVFTSNTDRDGVAYNIETNKWTNISDTETVYYSSYNLLQLTLKYFSIFSKMKNDIVYMNSFFSFRYSILPLIIIRLFFSSSSIKILIAARGEFSKGAISIKSEKKSIYLKFARALKLLNNVNFHASSEHELLDILRELNHRNFDILKSKIFVARNLSSVVSIPSNFAKKTNDNLKVCFLSRICEKKNLDYALQLIGDIEFNLEFNIYGTVEDEKYWELCRNLIDSLPGNIKVVHKGSIEPSLVLDNLKENDVFLFPTKGENFGHVILEALLAGLPIITSDQTPWGKFNRGFENVCHTINLCDKSKYTEVLREFYKMNEYDFAHLRDNAQNLGLQVSSEPLEIENNIVMFRGLVR